MKKILTTFLGLGFYLTPLTVMLMAQPAWGQAQNLRSLEAKRLLEQGLKKAGGRGQKAEGSI